LDVTSEGSRDSIRGEDRKRETPAITVNNALESFGMKRSPDGESTVLWSLLKC